jgi:DNA repair exonuclease SbcCD ATPase subunit
MNYETDETDSNISDISDMSVSNYKAEIKFLKTKTELDINHIKQILTALPPKNIRSSRKNITDDEKKKRQIKSNRIYLSRKTNLNKLQKLTEELDTYETIINDDDLNIMRELIDAKKELINTINTELKEEKEQAENDLLDLNENNEKLQTELITYQQALEELIKENEELKQKKQAFYPSVNYEIPSSFSRPSFY